MSNLSDMPVVTTEQIVRFRAQALEVERQRDELLSAIELLMKTAPEIANATDALLEEALECENKEVRDAANAFLVARAAVAKVKGSTA